DDVGLTRGSLTKAQRAAVLAIAQHENDLAPAVRLAKRIERLAERTPQRCRRVRGDRSGQRGGELFPTVGERGADGDLVPERADARDIGSKQAREELRR